VRLSVIIVMKALSWIKGGIMQREDYQRYIPFGDLGLIVMDSSAELGQKIDDHLIQMRKMSYKDDNMVPETYRIDKREIRFSNGEGKVFLQETVRGKDIYILTDIGNYNMTYS